MLLKHTKFNSGFSLIELALTIMIIAFMGTIIIIGVHRIQRTSRDAQRVSDIKNIQAALAAYYSINKIYPPTITTAPCGSTTATTDGLGNSDCNTLSDATNGFTSTALSTGVVYMKVVPKNPQPNGYVGGYNYRKISDEKYELRFKLEIGVGYMSSGCYTAIPNSIIPGC